MIWLLILLQSLEVNVYRYEGGYVEVWYQLPIAMLVDSREFNIPEDSVSASCSYTFRIRNEDGVDSALVEGRKNVCVYEEDWQDFIIDYLPIHLYPGRFSYAFDVHVEKGDFHDEGSIEIPQDTASLSCSDLVLGRQGTGQFLFHGIRFLPSVGADFTPTDKLLSYLELYDLVPDSLYYLADYKIYDCGGVVLQHDKREVLKYDYVQVDTHILDLSRLVSGVYTYTIEISDASSASRVMCSTSFNIATLDVLTDRKFYYEIQYLIGSDEYKEFLGLSDVQKEIYLKEFWSRRDYRQFEQRIIEADKLFSVSQLLGRDSERGRLYIMLGPPDEVETMLAENWARPFEIWHYYGKNDFLFSDIKDDHNHRLIKILKPGELTNVLNTGMLEGTREEEWLSDIVPSARDWYEDKENPE